MSCENCTKYDDCRTGSGLTWPCGAYRPKTGGGMDIEKLIEQLRYLADTPSYTAFHDAKEREIICDQCEADFCYDKQQDAHWCMYEALSRAATALSTLQAENKRLNKIVCSIPTTPDSGRTVSQYDKEMSMCAYLDDLEAENEKLRAEVESLKKGHCAGCSIPAVKAEQIRDLTDAPKLRAELEQVKAERDEAVQCIRGIAKSGRVWMCPYCVHAKDTTGGIAECELDVGVCMMPYSKFEWRGPHKED